MPLQLPHGAGWCSGISRFTPKALESKRLVVRGIVDELLAEMAKKDRLDFVESLAAIVPLADVWVDANFKEVQLRDMRIGQPVRLTADLYGGAVEYRGRVAGLGAGTGGAFALLPPQNATGNWVKVVQRVPLRLMLQPSSEDAPLRAGMSAEIEIDTGHVRELPGVVRSAMAWVSGE